MWCPLYLYMVLMNTKVSKYEKKYYYSKTFLLKLLLLVKVIEVTVMVKIMTYYKYSMLLMPE
jgi:hypothetical protein